MPTVSITRLRVRAWRYLPMFFFEALRSARQAARADGNLETKLLRDANRTFWTATTWSDERAMKAFMHAPPHGPAMRKLLEWCDEASLVHWTQPGAAVPPWVEAHARLQGEGRTSKVHHPSADHAAFRVAPPVSDSTFTLRAHPPSSS
jgi:hypothetical protein